MARRNHTNLSNAEKSANTAILDALPIPSTVRRGNKDWYVGVPPVFDIDGKSYTEVREVMGPDGRGYRMIRRVHKVDTIWQYSKYTGPASQRDPVTDDRWIDGTPDEDI